MSWLWSQFEEWWITTLRDFANALLQLISSHLAPHPYWSQPWAISVRNTVTAAAWSALAIVAIYESWRLYIAREAGEAMTPPSVLIRRVITAGTAIPLTSWGLAWILDLAQALTAEITALGGNVDLYQWGDSMLQGWFGRVVEAAETFGAALVGAIVILVMLFLALLLVMQAWIRGVELAIASMIGPICALLAARSDDALSSGMLGMWVREVCVLAFTQAIQTALLLGVTTLVLDGQFEIIKVIGAIPLLYVALRTPTILRNYVYASGSGWSGGGQSFILSLAGRVLLRKVW